MTNFGPVSDAAHGGYQSPTMNVMACLAILAITWVGYFKNKEKQRKASIWIAICISMICVIGICLNLGSALK